MGLDMFLRRAPKSLDMDNSDKLWDESVEVGYWRKANHIHNWFVQNCQDGVDECQEAEVSKEKLEELLNICKEVSNPTGGTIPLLLRKTIAEEKLPTVEGFFFGGTRYDECYYEDVEQTIGILEKVLNETDFENDKIFYASSW